MQLTTQLIVNYDEELRMLGAADVMVRCGCHVVAAVRPARFGAVFSCVMSRYPFAQVFLFSSVVGFRNSGYVGVPTLRASP